MKLTKLVTACSLYMLAPWLASGQDHSARILSASPAWLQCGIHWDRAPRDINSKLSAGAATVMYFLADGRFRMFSGTVYKQNGVITVSAGDSRSIFQGTWELQRSAIFIKYRLIDQYIKIVGEVLPGPEQTLKARLESKKRKLIKVIECHGLDFTGFEYEVSPRLSIQSLETQFSFLEYKGENPNM